MNQTAEQAAQYLVNARTNGAGPRMAEADRPADLDTALAIQARIGELLGESIGGWKCSMPSGDRTVVAPIWRSYIYRGPKCPALSGSIEPGCCSSGTRNPVSPSTTTSTIPPVALATTFGGIVGLCTTAYLLSVTSVAWSLAGVVAGEAVCGVYLWVAAQRILRQRTAPAWAPSVSGAADTPCSPE